MAEGFARHHGLACESAGAMPARELSHAAVVAMRERGIDISNQRPKRLEMRRLGEFERIISMGHGVKQSAPDLAPHADWGLDDPVNHPFPVMRDVRDAIELKVRKMADEIRQWSPPL